MIFAGQVRTSALLVEPGKSPTNVAVTNGQDVLQLIYQLPISRSMHNCRHVPGGDDGGCITNP